MTRIKPRSIAQRPIQVSGVVAQRNAEMRQAEMANPQAKKPERLPTREEIFAEHEANAAAATAKIRAMLDANDKA